MLVLGEASAKVVTMDPVLDVGDELGEARVRRLRWSHGEATVAARAGMLMGARFRVGDAWFSPFAAAPWAGQLPRTNGLPGHVAVLGGEFVGVPFGSSLLPGDHPPAWSAHAGTPLAPPEHGVGADAEWAFTCSTASSATLSMDYPSSSAVSRLERTVEGVEGRPELHFRLVVHARRPAHVPVGLHPVLRLPERPGRLKLSAAFQLGVGYPGTVAGVGTAASPDARFTDLAAVPGPRGPVDVSRLPLGPPVEDVLQLCGMRGPVRARYLDEGAGVELDWDRRVLPSVLLWVSDRGLGEPPWSGRYRGLGVEPVAAAFDLPPEVSVSDNPLSTGGHRTSVRLDPHDPVVIDYSVRAFDAPAVVDSANPRDSP